MRRVLRGGRARTLGVSTAVFFLDIFFAETSRGRDETRLSVPLVARPPCHRTCLYARDLRGLRGSPARTSRRRSCVCRSCFTWGNRLQSLIVSGRCSLSSGREAPSGNPTSFGSGLVALDPGRSLCGHGCGLGTTTSALISFAFSCVRLLRSALRRFARIRHAVCSDSNEWRARQVVPRGEVEPRGLSLHFPRALRNCRG